MKYSDYDDPQFQKVFEFTRTHEWRLPKNVFSSPKFEISELQAMKRELNQVKGKLSGFNLADWTVHTQNRDVAGYIISQLKKRIKPELLTQAWCKFYEIISTFSIAKPSESGCFRSVHLCEAPGAFICALNHYLVLHYPEVNWQWLANTLNPDYEGNSPSCMISDDRLLCYTRNKWLFGSDLTGDIQHFNNHVDIVSHVDGGKVNMVTADGSVNCMSDPGEQEKTVEFLHYCETVTALTLLDVAGSFVLKIFTIFEDSTICLLYLLNCIFDKTFLFKPCTSKSGNSELYLVCMGFSGYHLLSPIWEKLVKPYKRGYFDKNVSMFAIDNIPSSFLVQLKSCCTDFFLEKQINTINDNIYYFLNPCDHENNYLHSRKIDIANRYIRKYQLKRIPNSCRVVSYKDIHRRQNLDRPCQTRMVCMKDWSLLGFVEVSKGRRIETVHSSKFASAENLKNLAAYSNKNSTLYNLIVQALDKTCRVINGNSFKLNPYYQFQKDLFFTIQASLGQEKHIFFINVPFHTHFLAGVWSLLASVFENVYFGAGWCLFFRPLALKLESVQNVFSSIEKGYLSLSNSDFLDIIYVLDPNVFNNELNFVPEVLRVYNNFQVPIIYDTDDKL